MKRLSMTVSHSNDQDQLKTQNSKLKTETISHSNGQAQLKTQNSTLKTGGTPTYPFAAIVGQAELKQALLLCVIDPTIGGVMVMGHRGTAKSTAVRALAGLMPPMRVVAGCPYGCNPAAPSAICPH